MPMEVEILQKVHKGENVWFRLSICEELFSGNWKTGSILHIWKGLVVIPTVCDAGHLTPEMFKVTSKIT